MAWVLIDDNFPNHPKVLKAGKDAAYLFLCGLCYCRKFHTGGVIQRAAVPTLGAGSSPRRLVDKLVSSGLWDVTEDGFVVHDYDGFYSDESDKAQRDTLRQSRRDAGRAGGLESAKTRASNAHVASHVASSKGGMEWNGSSDLLLEEKKREADFGVFWASYPRKDGKQAALAAWRKVDPDIDTQRVIALDIERRSRSTGWLKDGGQFVPHARTYLSQRRWEDGFAEQPTMSDTTLRVVKGAMDYAAGE